ncbi:MAG: nitroreductase family deazaflavin-dependent oxidoreductase [Candidatus Limnocylindria bacterium]
MTTSNETTRTSAGRLPPRPIVRAAWAIHRALYRLLGRRRALRPVTDTTWGMMRLTTVGRKSGRERAAILGYFADGPNLVTMAMNGWGAPEPAWWLNLQAQPDTTVELHDRTLAVRGRAATPEERPRLWERWRQYDGADLDAWASRRPHETAVVILEPR